MNARTLTIFRLYQLFNGIIFTGPVWAEMPTDRALISVTRGQATVRINGEDRTLRRDGKMYVEQGDSVTVGSAAETQTIEVGD